MESAAQTYKNMLTPTPHARSALTPVHTRRHTKMHTERASVSELRTTPRGGKAPVFVCVRLWVCVRVAEHTLCFRRMGDGGGVEG